MNEHPLRLAVGSHRAGSGKGCAMNVVSWENGDTTISDLPACADLMLAHVVQKVNDAVCAHRDGDLLCPACSVLVLELAHRTVGTSSHGLSTLDLRRVWVRVAADQARLAQHLNTDPRVEAAIVAAETWADHPTNASADAAAYAAYATAASAAYATAADAAAYAAYATAASAAYASAAASAADAASAAYATAADAAASAAASAADAVTARLALAHRAIDLFTDLTGITHPPVDPTTTARAIDQMLQVSQ